MIGPARQAPLPAPPLPPTVSSASASSAHSSALRAADPHAPHRITLVARGAPRGMTAVPQDEEEEEEDGSARSARAPVPNLKLKGIDSTSSITR